MQLTRGGATMPMKSQYTDDDLIAIKETKTVKSEKTGGPMLISRLTLQEKTGS